MLTLPVVALLSSCGKKDVEHDHAHDHAHAATPAASGHGHVHLAPHGGTAVILGAEVFHVELVRDADRGAMQAFLLDGHMEAFVRSADPSFEIIATVAGEPRTLVFRPATDAATGERPGDASLFTAEAEWLKTTAVFDGVLTRLTIRGAEFTNVAFNFPKGNAAR